MKEVKYISMDREDMEYSLIQRNDRLYIVDDIIGKGVFTLVADKIRESLEKETGYHFSPISSDSIELKEFGLAKQVWICKFRGRIKGKYLSNGEIKIYKFRAQRQVEGIVEIEIDTIHRRYNIIFKEILGNFKKNNFKPYN